jgi:hypothetical protein
VSETLRSPYRNWPEIVVDKIGDKIDAVWPERTDDGRMHYFPCTIKDFRGEGEALHALVQWDDPGTFEETTWLCLDQVRDRMAVGAETMATKSVTQKCVVRKGGK